MLIYIFYVKQALAWRFYKTSINDPLKYNISKKNIGAELPRSYVRFTIKEKS